MRVHVALIVLVVYAVLYRMLYRVLMIGARVVADVQIPEYSVTSGNCVEVVEVVNTISKTAEAVRITVALTGVGAVMVDVGASAARPPKGAAL